jgi:Cu-processing system ATP-binding protein
MISVKNIRKNFNGMWALDGVDADLTPGNAYALIGPNGSGKTTLIKTILGLVVPTSGNITVNGESILGNWAYREHIGYMPQIGHYPDNMRMGQLIEMIKNIRNPSTQLDEELIQLFQLEALYNKPMHTLSGGMRQKVSAALAFLFNPAILILDEPTAGLDPISVEHLKEKIQREKANGKLFLITSHIMSDLDELATELIYIYEGKIAYRDSIDHLKQETGQDRLGKAISEIMKQLSIHS